MHPSAQMTETCHQAELERAEAKTPEQHAAMDDMGDYFERLDAQEFDQRAKAGLVQARLGGLIK